MISRSSWWSTVKVNIKRTCYPIIELIWILRQPLKIRSQINKFRKNYWHTVEPITPGNQEEITDFLVNWCESKRCNDNFILAHEVEAVFYAVEHFTKLPLRGLLIRVNSQVAVISLFERLNANTALIHFEKGLPEYDEIYKVINAETAAILASEVEYINRESDLGVIGLRKAKLRYHPHHMVEVYSLKRQTWFQFIKWSLFYQHRRDLAVPFSFRDLKHYVVHWSRLVF